MLRPVLASALTLAISATSALADPPDLQRRADALTLQAPSFSSRGRDPWVFRCIFEDRTRMVILAPAPDLWIAFNPNTCAVQKIWQGKMKFRGKVWDFSQENCAADGQVLAEAPSVIWSLPDSDKKQPATLSSVHFDPSRMWVFDGDRASITTPPLMTFGWSRVFVAFDETSRKGPFHIEVSDDYGASWRAQSFDSTTSGSSDTDWQWNFKSLREGLRTIQLRISQQYGSDHKALRKLRIFGDSDPWRPTVDEDVAGQPAPCQWLGYALDDKASECKLQYAVLLGEKRVFIDHSFGQVTSEAGKCVMVERFRPRNFGPMGVTLRLPTPAVPVEYVLDGQVLSKDATEISFTQDTEYVLTTTFKLGANP